MTPDELTIVIVGTIGGMCLLSLLFSLIVLANIDRIRRLLRIETPPPTLPAHYVVPYIQSGPLVEPVGTIHAPTPQRRSTYHASSSDEHLPPRNATPGPSNVPRTPPPAYNPTDEAEEYGRFLWTVFRSPTPPLPLITIPDSPEAPVRALIPEPNNETLRTPSPLRRQRLSGTLHTGGVRIATSTHLCPLPDSDSDSGSNSDSSDFGGNEPVAEQEDDDPLNPNGNDYEPESSGGSTSNLEADSRDQRTEFGWGDTSPSPEDPRSPASVGTPPFPPASTTTIFERTTTHRPETEYETHAPEPTRNNDSSPTSYWPSHLPRETVPTWMEPPDFDNFNQDLETFGWADEEEEMDTALDYRGYTPTPADDRDYRGYTSAPEFYHHPFPLPDSPNYAGVYQAYPPPPPHPQRVQQYRPLQYGQYQFGGQGPDDPEPIPGGPSIPVQPPQPNNAE
ncbi:uncharacterized protein ARMOST_09936 [Armillaria ostoyae]|uniref:Uncharacterized protein n=1 Tax=Armillaria ostoyae TaxID=47428 RepID=A0A284RCX8_ARMOS|nr:uncharacterized protein ARMOST_09936 [Armillaria ostoyae]